MTECFRLLVIEYHLVSAEYFLDYMTQYELDIFLGHLNYAYRPEYEQMRFLAYINVSLNMDRKKHPNFDAYDIVKFPWENEEQQNTAEPMTEEDYKRLDYTAKHLNIDWSKV